MNRSVCLASSRGRLAQWRSPTRKAGEAPFRERTSATTIAPPASERALAPGGVPSLKSDAGATHRSVRARHDTSLRGHDFAHAGRVRSLFIALGVSMIVCVSLSAGLYVVAWKIAERRRWPRP